MIRTTGGLYAKSPPASLNNNSLNTYPKPSGMLIQKGKKKGEVFAQHFPNT